MLKVYAKLNSISDGFAYFLVLPLGDYVAVNNTNNNTGSFDANSTSVSQYQKSSC